MSSTNTHPNQPPPDGELASFQGDNPALFDASAGSSTFNETPEYDQVRIVLHRFNDTLPRHLQFTPAQIEAWWRAMVQMLQQFNVPFPEASSPELLVVI
jgi:hypothetical protein